MSMTEILQDLKEHITEGEAWFAKVLEQHVPALLAEGERLTRSPIVKALAGVILPPETEQAIAALITKFAAAYGTPPAGPAAAAAAGPAGEPAAGVPAAAAAPAPDQAAAPAAV